MAGAPERERPSSGVVCVVFSGPHRSSWWPSTSPSASAKAWAMSAAGEHKLMIWQSIPLMTVIDILILGVVGYAAVEFLRGRGTDGR